MKLALYTLVTLLGLNACLFAQIPTNGLVAYYPFNGNANDASGNGNNGINTGAILTADRFGNPNSSYLFNGVNNYITCPNIAIQYNEARSICAWIKTAVTTYQHIVSTGLHNNSCQAYNFGISYDDIFVNGYSSLCSWTSQLTPEIHDNKWHFICCTSSSSITNIYIDGVLIGTTGNGGFAVVMQNNYIGRSNQTSNYKPFSGAIDDVLFYNRVLTPIEIYKLFIQGNTSIATGLNSVPQPACISLKMDSVVQSYTWSSGNNSSEIDVCTSGVYTCNNGPGVGFFISNSNDTLTTPNGLVYALNKIGDTIYVGGDFGCMARVTGSAALLNLNSSSWYDKDMPRTNGNIDVIVPDGVGGWYLAGDFTKVGIDSMPYLAHIKNDKTVDTAFKAKPNGKILTMVASGNRLYVGGQFTQIGDVNRNYLAVLDGNSGMATSWDGACNGIVRSILIFSNKLYVGGDFTSIGGLIRNYIAAVDTIYAQASTWNPGANGKITKLASSGVKLYVSGDFTTISNQPRNFLASFTFSTGLLDVWDPNPNGAVKAILPYLTGVYVGGSFTSIGSANRFCLAQVNSSTGQALPWNANITDNINLSESVNSIILLGNNIVIGGLFDKINNNSQNRIAALSLTDGSLISWNPGIISNHSEYATFYVNTLSTWNNQIYTGGRFFGLNRGWRFNIAAIKASTGELLPPVMSVPEANARVRAIYADANYLYIGGDFTSVANGIIKNRIAQISRSTTMPTGWNPNADGNVHTLAAKGLYLYVGGEFTNIGGNTRPKLSAIKISDGTSSTWNPNPNNIVRSIAIGGDTLFAGGDFTTISSTARNHLASFNLQTNSLTGFNPDANNSIYALAFKNKSLFVGGAFNTISAQTRANFAIYNTQTGVIKPFNPAYLSLNNIYSIAAVDSAAYMGGKYAFQNNIYQNHNASVVKTNNGKLSQWWHPETNNTVRAICPAGDMIYIGGDFTEALSLYQPYLISVDPFCSVDAKIATPLNNELCEGDSIPLHATLGTGYTYQWYLNGSAIAGATAHTWYPQQTGYYKVKITDNINYGTLFSDAILMTVDLLADTVIDASGALSFCGGSVTLTAMSNPLFSYLWHKDGQPINNANTSSLIVTTSGNYFCQIYNSSGCPRNSQHILVNAVATPEVAGPISGTTSVCIGQTGITYTVPAISAANSYVWTIPPGATGSSSTNSITVSFLTGTVSGNVTVKGHNACGDGPVSILPVSVLAQPDAAGTISGIETVCQGQSGIVYTVPAISGASGYVWTLPTGATGTSTTNSIAVTYGNTAVSGNITVKGTNTCGNGSSSNFVITVNPLPAAAGTITGSAQVCAGQSMVTYTVPSITNATSYNWTIPTGATYSGSGNSITVTYSANAVSGDISVNGTNACGEGSLSVLPVILHQPPVANAGSDQIIIQGNTANLSASATGGSAPYTYTWSNGANGQNISVSPVSTTSYTVTVTDAFGCTSTDAVVVTVAAGNILTTIAPTMNACPGNVVVPITVSNCNDVASVSLTLQYNSAVLTYTGYENSNPLLASGFLMVNASNGQVQLGWFGITPVSIGNGSLIDFKFTGVLGNSLLTWNTITQGACAYSDINNTPISSLFINGNVTIGNCSNLDGTVSYFNTAVTPMNNTTVLLKQNGVTVNQVNTNSSGQYLFQNLANGTYRIDGTTGKQWGGVNAGDGLLILKHFVNLTPLTGLKLAAADVDGSGYVNSSDALVSVRRFVNLINSFTVGDWVFEKDTVVIEGTGNITNNFKALCYGDVDGSYIPGLKTEPSISLENDGILRVQEKTDISIPIRIKDNIVLASISLIMEIPDDYVTVKDVTVGHEGNTVFHQDGNTLKIGWYSIAPILLKADDVLLTVNCSFSNPKESSLNSWSLDPASQVTDEDAIAYDPIRLTMPKLQLTDNLFYLDQNVPNPFSDITEISYYLPEQGAVNIIISDLFGRTIMTVVESVQDAGLKKAIIHVNSLSPGVYTYTLQVKGITQDYRKTLKMIIDL